MMRPHDERDVAAERRVEGAGLRRSVGGPRMGQRRRSRSERGGSGGGCDTKRRGPLGVGDGGRERAS